MNRRFSGGRLIVALLLAGFALLSYCSSRQFNPVTGEDQYVGISQEQEIALGLQAAPQMAAEFGGEDRDPEAQAFLDQVCGRLVQTPTVQQTEWPLECTLLADPETVNAFALPGGPTFITAALYDQLQTEGQLAGVMGHEIGHVLARHSAQQIARMELTQGLTGAVIIAAYDPDNPGSANTAQIAAVIGQLINMRYSREHELESDRLGVRLMAQANYDPRALIEVMTILEEAAGGGNPPEFFSTHPNPENRRERIQEAIDQEFPNGVPEGLTP